MLVHKSTVVRVGDGTRDDIVKSLMESQVPGDAVIGKVGYDFEMVAADSEWGLPTFKNYTTIEFEWDDEE